MDLQTKVEQTPDVAVLCQNHRIYLEHAAKIGDREPGRTIAFRATDIWRSGQVALQAHGPRKIYLVPDDALEVEYEATLQRLLLNPAADDPQTKEFLRHCLPETQDQGLWEQYGDQVRTLYMISHCQWIASPFPFTALTKLSDGQRVGDNYNYGYVLVHEIC
jgi:hypothetical protein